MRYSTTLRLVSCLLIFPTQWTEVENKNRVGFRDFILLGRFWAKWTFIVLLSPFFFSRHILTHFCGNRGNDESSHAAHFRKSVKHVLFSPVNDLPKLVASHPFLSLRTFSVAMLSDP